jgi:predicted kinase
MILLLNGAFGIGKTTVAKELRRRLPGSVIFDPEHVGALIMLFPPRRDDYQDSPAWRALTVAGIQTVRRLSQTVIVPMAFTNLGYLDQIRRGAARADRDVRHICLTAPLEVVTERLERRAAVEGRAGAGAWQLRRARECCEVHGGPAFAEQVQTEGLGPADVADEIVRRLAGMLVA